MSSFDQHARFDSVNGRLFGYAWSENAGWINLDDADHFVSFSPNFGSIGHGDSDNDGDVDLVDFGAFQLCYSGTDSPMQPGCECSDFDGDNDVDLLDFGAFQIAFTGG